MQTHTTVQQEPDFSDHVKRGPFSASASGVKPSSYSPRQPEHKGVRCKNYTNILRKRWRSEDLSPSVIAGGEAEMKSVSVKEGEPVTLHVPQLQGDVLIVWRFGDEGKLIAKHDIEAKSSPLYDTDERFRDRLKLDQTGSLTITKTRTTDSGLYKVKISTKTVSLTLLTPVNISVINTDYCQAYDNFNI
uniref:Ig-like domain-containing protein n=1 Tax=Sinocyclocheilus grahami TaxID=75366 RepID=A0A672MAE6_SINGR